MFDKFGFHNTSLDDIARAVGIRREGIYYYYRNRADILVDIVRPMNEALNARLETILAADLCPTTKVYLAIKSHILQFNRTSYDMLIMGIGGHAEPDVDSVHAAMLPLYRHYEEMWIRLVEEGRSAGMFRATGDTKIAVYAILGFCNWTPLWLDPHGRRSVDEIAGEFYRLAAEGLLASESRNGGCPRTRFEDVRAEAALFEAAQAHDENWR